MVTARIKEVYESLEHYRRTMQIEARVLLFEDSLTRHISLTQGEWAGFDWLIGDYGLCERALLAETFDAAKCWPNTFPVPFEFALRHSLRELISTFVSSRRYENHGVANDNDQVWVAPSIGCPP